MGENFYHPPLTMFPKVLKSLLKSLLEEILLLSLITLLPDSFAISLEIIGLLSLVNKPRIALYETLTNLAGIDPFIKSLILAIYSDCE